MAGALLARGVTLVYRDGPESEAGYGLLAKARVMAPAHQFPLVGVPIVDIHKAIRKAQRADVDGAIELVRAVLDNLFAFGDFLWRGASFSPSLSIRCCAAVPAGTSPEGHAAIDRLAAVPTDQGYVIYRYHRLGL